MWSQIIIDVGRVSRERVRVMWDIGCVVRYRLCREVYRQVIPVYRLGRSLFIFNRHG